ncbi:MAG TPA: alpha/beta hydrolase [Sphingomonas sp.]|nr:alpha/beta hydrolase [Sphingomonas sp.]
MKRRIALPAALALLSCAAAGIGQSAPVIADKSVRDDVFPAVTAPYPRGIVARPHVEFANYVGYRPLQLDLYLHTDRRAARPLILWIHGGGWNRGDARGSGAFADWPGVLAGLAARGYVVAAVDYRLSGEARFPAQVQDVKAAIRFLRSKAGDYDIDPKRVYLWGGSAGGHLAALAATTCGVAAFDPPASTGRLPHSQAARAMALAQSDCVQGAAIWYGAFDLVAHGNEPGTALAPTNMAGLLGCAAEACEAAERAASPTTYVKRDTPPMLLIHGTADEEVSVEQTRHMAAQLAAAGVPVETLFIPGANHGWIGKTPADTRRYSLLAYERTLAFFDRLSRR